MKKTNIINEVTLLHEMKRSLKDDAEFFSNNGKEAREIWVVREFLRRIKLPFEDSELVSQRQVSKIDVQFRFANFQIKEITDPNIKRGDEVRAAYKKVRDAKTLEDTLGPGFLYDVPMISSAYQLVREKASGAKYNGHKAKLDLLCYVTRTRASKISVDEVQLPELTALGWRSISCLIGDQATVLCIAHDAPLFLIEAAKNQVFS
ncbi:DUF1780 domain-containing protein [Janthinobacterium sp. HSC-3S05]|uniref:DUF1780 domain-containing protein n=1 Tax=Janthinobacterium lividum TaxID=29581 RepID=UPI001CD8464E|nr:DUF1780 domain-containing protein [Janthinobacterium lividum]MCA1860783.1 DUF1780 domain-containing protein [Janthinobacterium lividum]